MGSWRASGSDVAGGGDLIPVPGQQLGDALGGVIGEAGEDVGEPGARVDIFELAGLCRQPNYAEQFWNDVRVEVLSTVAWLLARFPRIDGTHPAKAREFNP